MRQMAFKAASKPQNLRDARAGKRASRSVSVHVSCQQDQHPQQAATRRSLLTAGAGAALLTCSQLFTGTAPASADGTATIPVSQLGSFQKNAQIATFRERAQGALKEVLTAADAPACMRLVLHDAGTYDSVTKAGGMDGSIVLSSEELGRPENSDLKPLVERLRDAKAKIDAAGEADGSGPISWADLLVLAAKVSTQESWRAVKLKRAQIKSGGETIAGPAFGAAWPVRLGRVDAAAPGPAGKVPQADAPVEDIKVYLASLNTKPGASAGPFAAKPPFWERPAFVLWTAAAADPAAEEERFVAADEKTWGGIKTAYDRSRRTITRTDYEVDFIDFFTALTNVGATFKPDAYLHPEVVLKLN